VPPRQPMNTTLENPMPPKGARIAGAMSGGVDSAVTAKLLVDAGYDCVGVTLRLVPEHAGKSVFEPCCGLEAAEDARRAAETYAEAARTRVDQLNEAAFEAGRKADAAFETRLNEAKGLIDQAAGMIDAAGGKATERLDQWTVSARTTLGDLEKLMGEIAERAEALPAEAERRAEAVRASMEQNLGNLVASVKHASDETQALDEAFQRRVRANYQMLSEAVRLMGVVAGEPGAAPAEGEGQPSNLRGRLRLTPAGAEAAESEPEPEAEPEEEGLGWTGLLESLDRDATAAASQACSRTPPSVTSRVSWSVRCSPPTKAAPTCFWTPLRPTRADVSIPSFAICVLDCGP